MEDGHRVELWALLGDLEPGVIWGHPTFPNFLSVRAPFKLEINFGAVKGKCWKWPLRPQLKLQPLSSSSNPSAKWLKP
eukprot:1142389-Pelagomonas_calceolata.AAC.1